MYVWYVQTFLCDRQSAVGCYYVTCHMCVYVWCVHVCMCKPFFATGETRLVVTVLLVSWFASFSSLCRLYMFVYAWIYVCVYVYHVCIGIFLLVYACMLACMYACMHVHLCVCMHLPFSLSVNNHFMCVSVFFKNVYVSANLSCFRVCACACELNTYMRAFMHTRASPVEYTYIHTYKNINTNTNAHHTHIQTYTQKHAHRQKHRCIHTANLAPFRPGWSNHTYMHTCISYTHTYTHKLAPSTRSKPMHTCISYTHTYTH